MIRINENILITNDALCFTLHRDLHRTKKSHGATIQATKILGYYGTLEKALNAIFEHEERRILENYEGDLKGGLELLRASYEELAEAIRMAVPTARVVIE